MAASVIATACSTRAEHLGAVLRAHKLSIAVAESCTGGLISAMLTDVAGSSDYFDRGYITYSNRAKEETLGVSGDLIDRFGAVSAACAEAMVRRVRTLTGCGVCIATTGIAGPGGGSRKKPVGLVYAAFYIGDVIEVKRLLFTGTRDDIRRQTANFCLSFAAGEAGRLR